MIPALVELFGFVVGSFLNSLRMPIVWPSSRCPDCGARIKAFDNVPLLFVTRPARSVPDL